MFCLRNKKSNFQMPTLTCRSRGQISVFQWMPCSPPCQIVRRYTQIQTTLSQKEKMVSYNSLHAGKFFRIFFCRLLTFSKFIFFQKILSGTVSECQTVRVQIKPDISMGLIWFQTLLAKISSRRQNSTKKFFSPENLKKILGFTSKFR